MIQKILTLLLLLIASASLWAQAPQQFKFQAVARDAGGIPYASTNLAVRVSIVRDGASGLIDYSERHNIITSPLGVFDLAIGNGVVLTGIMSDLDWANHPYYLKIDIDPNGGTDYLSLGSSQLLSVPYAIYAGESGSGDGGTDSQTLNYNSDTNMLSISNGNTISIPAGMQGEQGIQGEPGATGPQGMQGVQGEVGITGLQGEQGVQGVPGVAGVQGEIGESGVPGPVGPQGEMGEQGEQGEAGTGITLLGAVPTVADLPATANQGDLYIVDADGEGYAWDGSMWNNVGQIRGPQGEQGVQGEMGITGLQGEQGVQGVPGVAGVQGETGESGVPGPVGPQGEMGEQGEQGEAGTGITLLGAVPTVADLPVTANQGDLYIVDADGEGYAWDGSMWNNVGQIRGPQGEQGVQGELGTTGSQGMQGIPGAAGAQGEQGVQGIPGTQGIQGEQGLQGEMGVQGEQGIPGPAGDYTAGSGINIAANQISALDNSPTNELQSIQLAGTNLSLSNGGGAVDLGSLPAELSLPYYGTESEEGAVFQIHNSYDLSGYGLVGSKGAGADILPANSAGVAGLGVSAHGIYGLSNTGLYSGVYGVSDSADGIGVSGEGYAGGVGGHFSTTSFGRAALTTGVGRVGLGTGTPLDKVEITDDSKTRLSLNGEESGGISSMAFRHFQGIDSHQGWLWEARLDDPSKQTLSLFDYDYLLGTPDNENRKELYSLSKVPSLFGHSYTHRWDGTARFSNLLVVEGRNVGSSTIRMFPEAHGDIAKTIQFHTEYLSDLEQIDMTMQFYDYDTTQAINIYNPADMYKASYLPSGRQQHHFTGRLMVDGKDDEFSDGANIDLLLKTEDANHHINLASTSIDNNAGFYLGESYIGGGGEAAYVNPLYQATSYPAASPLGLGGSHWFYGHIQSDGLSLTDAPFSIIPPDLSSKLYVNPGAGNGQSGIHIDADNTDVAAFQVHNADGPAIETLGGVDVYANSTANRPHLKLQEEGNDFSRLEFANDINDARWHIAAMGDDGTTGATSSRMNFWFANDQGAANRMTIMGSGHVGIKNGEPDEELVIGSNLGSGWAVPAATIGNATLGGVIEVGTPDISFSAEATSIFDRTRLIASDENGYGQGLIEMRTRQLNVGTAPGVNTTTPYSLRVVQNNADSGGSYGFNLINKTTPSENWELFVEAAGHLSLYHDNVYRGYFSAVSGNYASTSDARLKTNIRSLGGILPRLMQLDAKSYNYKSDMSQVFNGFLAQDLQKVFPELVTESEIRNDETQSTLLVDYSQLSVLAIQSIQELTSQVEDKNTLVEQQTDKIAELTTQVETQNDRIERLEKQLEQVLILLEK